MIAGRLAVLVAGANLAYATSFLIVRPDDPDTGGTAASALLLVGGLLALPVVLALYRRLAPAGPPDLALCAVVLGVAGALGAAVHGGHDLAVAIDAPATASDGPNPADPRGLLTFGAAGLSVAIFAALARRDGRPRLALLGGALALGLVAVYLLRLIVVDADSAAIVAPAALVGFVLSPAWYLALSRYLAAAPRPAVALRP